MLTSRRFLVVLVLIVMTSARLLPEAALQFMDSFMYRPGDALLLLSFVLFGSLLLVTQQPPTFQTEAHRYKPQAEEPERVVLETLHATHVSLERAIDEKLLEVVTDTESSATSIIQEVRSLYDSSHKLVNYLDSSGLRGSMMEDDISACVSFMVDLGKFVHQLPEKINRDMESVQSVVKEITNLSDLVSSVQAIAMQSHLLAINAAIEGSHAGPSGAAFRVVATEMRTLASNTSEVASRINMGLARARNVVGTTMANSMAWPPRLTKIKVERTSKNWAMTGTFPRLGSIRLAIDRPIAFETACPATTTEAVTICSIRPMNTPITNWLSISSKPGADNGSITGQSNIG